jgi:hypothetical protein
MSTTFKIKQAVAQMEDPLCRTCRYAHIRKGFRESEEAIFCNFAEQLRPVPFRVAECTDYANRNVPYRYELEQMALLIDVPRARKKAGFRNAVGFEAEAERSEDSEEVSSEHKT